MDSPLWLIWLAMMAGGALAGFVSRWRRPQGTVLPSALTTINDADLLGIYRTILPSIEQDERRRLLIAIYDEIVRRGLPVPR